MSSFPILGRAIHDRDNGGFAAVFARGFDQDAKIVDKIGFVGKTGARELRYGAPLTKAE
jgi:hypothetical protein